MPLAGVGRSAVVPLLMLNAPVDVNQSGCQSLQPWLSQPMVPFHVSWKRQIYWPEYLHKILMKSTRSKHKQQIRWQQL
jgi:hypothetical protein